MQMLAAILLVIAALAFAGAAHRARSGRLLRLRRLVAPAQRAAETQAADIPRAAERLLPRGIARRLRLLGIEMNLRSAALVFGMGGLPVMAAAALSGPVAAVALAGALLLIALMALNLLAARRVAELGVLLPAFFDRVRQLLIVGNSLPTAFLRAAQDTQPRLMAFFAPTLRRMANGASFPESIRQCAEDIDLYEMRLFAAAVATNMRFGGSLTHSLNNLVGYLRKRASIERELRASTAQIRASAWVLGLLPMAVASLIVFDNRDYASWFITHPDGKKMLAYCIVSQIIGAFLMRAVVRTRF